MGNNFERTITVSPQKFFAEGLTPRDVMPLVTGEESPLVDPAEWGKPVDQIQLWGHPLDDYDWIAWCCDIVGFNREDIGAVMVEVDVRKAAIVLRLVTVGRDWIPEYVVGIEELLLGETPGPELRDENV